MDSREAFERDGISLESYDTEVGWRNRLPCRKQLADSSWSYDGQLRSVCLKS
jgi:hypothetical protein